jgi:hypothetical protein
LQDFLMTRFLRPPAVQVLFKLVIYNCRDIKQTRVLKDRGRRQSLYAAIDTELVSDAIFRPAGNGAGFAEHARDFFAEAFAPSTVLYSTSSRIIPSGHVDHRH